MHRGAPDSISTRLRTSSRHRNGSNGRCGSSRPTLRLNQDDQQQLLPHARLTRYGADEYLQFTGQVPKRMTFIVNGRVRLVATDDDGALVPVRTLEQGDFLGQTTLTREPVTAAAYALDEVTVLQIERGTSRSW